MTTPTGPNPRLCVEHVYGRSPKPPRPIQFEVTSLDRQALGGKATRKEVTVFLVRNGYAIWQGPECDREFQIFS